VLETGQGGADGGVDLLLQGDGKKRLVQCKQWKQRKVGVNVVSEQFGWLTHHCAERATIVSVGEFTPGAQRFVEGKPIDLVNGADLVELIRSVQTPAMPAPEESLLLLSDGATPPA
jgi:restriction system protein